MDFSENFKYTIDMETCLFDLLAEVFPYICEGPLDLFRL